MMLLPKNTVLKERETAKVWRILDEISSRETKDSASTHYVVIDVLSESGVPTLFGKLMTLARLGAGELIVIEEIFEALQRECLSNADRALMQRRWRLVQFAHRLGPRIWDPAFRGRLAKRLAGFKICSKPFFYNTLRLYWQRGLTKEAVSTNLWRCGAPGEPRLGVPDGPKPGRPRSIQPGIGVSATEEHRRNMRLAWSSAPVGKDGRYLKKAWEWMLITRYYEHVKVVPKNDDSHEVEVQNYDRVPTFEQFKYHWEQEHAYDVRQLKRLQQRRFDLAFKPLLSGTLPEVRGPGTRYYIDATVLDVYAVSRFNRRRIVGRPTLYVVIDQFSRMVVGIYVGLEPPCWAGAMLALWNCSVNKVAYCQNYGITITEAMWPTGHMPVHLMGDKGELKTEDASRLSEGFNLDVENARGYSGEAKGVVERVFRTLHTIFGPFLPGYIDKELAGRDQEPAILRSAQTIDEITRSVINAVLIANTRVVRDYDGWPEVIASGTPFVPVRLWDWGVENLRADVRTYPELHLKKYLWPRTQMKVTQRGLQLYRGLYYMGDELRQQSWFAPALSRDALVDVLYHPLDGGNAVVLPSGSQTAACDVALTRRCAKWGIGSFSEIAALELQRKKQNAAAAWTSLPGQLAAYESILQDAAQGKRDAEKARLPGETRSERTRGIKENRDAELTAMTLEVAQKTLPPSAEHVVPSVPPSSEAAVVDEAVGRTAEAARRLFQKRSS